ncbi:MAG: YjjG family noncanonical pyrimidine nucleotidase [Oscillospiraceae bacterium]|jgi:YjjG family noncanonical pyrimidine nucleotidase|nr:YjjG family noncanonical pyrimidine nucleotidase [Oscillospiraceae bacterium]
MGQYSVLLLDADGTLFDYDKAERNALRDTLSLYGFEFSEKALRQFRQINGELEKQLERGEISVNAMQSRRFARFFEAMPLQCDPGEFNSLYIKQLEQYVFLLDDADLVCGELYQTSALYVVTNGISSVQRGRLTRSGLLPYMSGLFISEEIGFQKPHRYFFDAVFTQLGDVSRDRILIVGDSLSTDVAGGHTAGLDTCWYNPKHNSDKGALLPTYEIGALIELLDICG